MRRADIHGGPSHSDPIVKTQVLHDIEGDKRPYHVERTMCEVRDVEDPVDKGQTERYEAVDTTEGQPIENLLEKYSQTGPSRGDVVFVELPLPQHCH